MDYYNDNEPYAGAWLLNLMRDGLIPVGAVDRSSITEIHPDNLAGYRRAHFFAGIAGWAQALKLAGWPEDVPVWTGSCPCQPFSISGKKKGESDVRHLWPVWRNLIAQRRPPVIFGEQVASPLGRAWLSGVRSDLEALGYRVGAADLCAAGVGAPHIRQRLYWVADAESGGWEQEGGSTGENAGASTESGGRRGVRSIGVADAGREGLEERVRHEGVPGGAVEADARQVPERGGVDRGVAVSVGGECQEGDAEVKAGDYEADPWADSYVVPCGDGRARRAGTGVLALAHGIPARVGKLRAYGNAIVPKVAATFIKAYMESRR